MPFKRAELYHMMHMCELILLLSVHGNKLGVLQANLLFDEWQRILLTFCDYTIFEWANSTKQCYFHYILFALRIRYLQCLHKYEWLSHLSYNENMMNMYLCMNEKRPVKSRNTFAIAFQFYESEWFKMMNI